MDDRTFDDPKVAQEWIDLAEGERAQVREWDIFPRLKSWVDQTLSREILEIGSGQGICSSQIQVGYTGLEPSPLLLERAKERYASKSKKFVLGNVYQMPFADAGFDAAFAISVWHLLGDLQKAAQEMSRVLRAEGHFFLITANPGAYSRWTESYTDSKWEGRRFEGKSGDSRDVLYLHTLEELTASLESADLTVQTMETFRSSGTSPDRPLYLSIQGQKIRKPIDGRT